MSYNTDYIIYKPWQKPYLLNFKRAAISVILIVVFILLGIVLVKLLLGEIEFNTAERFVDKYKSSESEARFEKAIAIDPFNTQYIAGMAGLLLKKAESTGYHIDTLNKTISLYKRAISLNPYSAQYYMKLAEAQIIAFLKADKFVEDDQSRKDALVEIISNLRSACLYDSNGFNISYSVGYAGLSVWKYLSGEDKEFILGRLRYCLESHPWYAKHIYSRLWEVSRDFALLQSITPDTLKSNEHLYNFVTSNNLWQFRRAQIDKLKKLGGSVNSQNKLKPADIVENINKEVWAGTADDNINIYKDGAMYWTGTMSQEIQIPGGATTIKLQARGSSANGVYPYMVLSLDGKDIAELYITNKDWEVYNFKIESDIGIKVLSVNFANDGSSKDGKEDRNLYIGRAEVI